MKTKNKFKFLRKTKNTIKKSLIFLLFISFFIFSSNTTTKSEIITNKTITQIINENTKNYKTVIENYIKEKIKNNERNINKIRFYLDIKTTISNFIKTTKSFYTINDKLIIKIDLKEIFSIFYSKEFKTKKKEIFEIFLSTIFFKNKITKENWNINSNNKNNCYFYFLFNKNEDSNNYEINEIIFTKKNKTLENSNQILTLKMKKDINYLINLDNHRYYDTVEVESHYEDTLNNIILTKSTNSYKNQVIKKITKENKKETKEKKQQITENKKQTKENKKQTKENKKETKENKKETKDNKLSKNHIIIIIVLSVLTFISLIFLCFYIKDKYKK